MGKVAPSADGEYVTSGGSRLPQRPSRPGKGDHLGRSPDLRVIDLADLPEVSLSGIPTVSRRLQLRGQSRNWVAPHRVPFSSGL